MVKHKKWNEVRMTDCAQSSPSNWTTWSWLKVQNKVHAILNVGSVFLIGELDVWIRNWFHFIYFHSASAKHLLIDECDCYLGSLFLRPIKIQQIFFKNLFKMMSFWIRLQWMVCHLTLLTVKTFFILWIVNTKKNFLCHGMQWNEI